MPDSRLMPPDCPARMPRPQPDRRILGILCIISTLLMTSTGVLGYQMGRDAAVSRLARDMGEQGGMFVTSLLPVIEPSTGFERMSILGSVLDARGGLLPDTVVTLRGGVAGEKPAFFSENGSFAVRGLAHGKYAFVVVGKSGRKTVSLEIQKSQRHLVTELNLREDGSYLLSSCPHVGSVSLHILLDGDGARLSLHDEEVISLNVHQVWHHDTPASIFSERLGNRGVQTIQGQNVIAPGSHGTFIFAVENPGPFPLQYSISLEHADENRPALPLRYRLMLDVVSRENARPENYPLGEEWMPPEAVVLEGVWLSGNAERFYTLHWMWPSWDDQTDTAIGMQEGRPQYRLRINVYELLPRHSLQNLKGPL